MNDNINTFLFRVPLSNSENKALNRYCYENGLKKGSMIRFAIVRELNEHNLLCSEGYVPPKVTDALKKNQGGEIVR